MRGSFPLLICCIANIFLVESSQLSATVRTKIIRIIDINIALATVFHIVS